MLQVIQFQILFINSKASSTKSTENYREMNYIRSGSEYSKIKQQYYLELNHDDNSYCELETNFNIENSNRILIISKIYI